MSDSDKDTSAAIDKVVGAFRAQREQEDRFSESTGQSTQEPTPVKKLDDAPTPQGGGGSEAPTKAFKIPTAAAASKTSGDDADAPGDLREENVVGDPMSAEPVDADTADAAAEDAKTEIVEQSIDLPADQEPDADDAAKTEQISADEVAAAAAAAKSQSVDIEKPAPGSEAPTTAMKVPATAAAAAAAPPHRSRNRRWSLRRRPMNASARAASSSRSCSPPP